MDNERPMHFIVCLSDHDHKAASNEECRGHAREAYVPFTDEEMQQAELDAIQFATEKAEREAAEAAAAALKASARAKLISGEPLTEEEAATLIL